MITEFQGIERLIVFLAVMSIYFLAYLVGIWTGGNQFTENN